MMCMPQPMYAYGFLGVLPQCHSWFLTVANTLANLPQSVATVGMGFRPNRTVALRHARFRLRRADYGRLTVAMAVTKW